MPKQEKTNVMRVLEEQGIPYIPHEYLHGAAPVDGVTVAACIGKSVDQVFKTLVTQGSSHAYYVFVIPVATTLDLKKAARAVREKAIELIPVREINKLTGYVRGGCSPVGMRKKFPIVFAEEVILVDSILVSAGKIGVQIEVEPNALMELLGSHSAPLIVENAEE